MLSLTSWNSWVKQRINTYGGYSYLEPGGDGLTYEMFIWLKRYLQFHSDVFQSFALLEPVLELWHTLWTDLSRLFECHWPAGSLTSQDPSTLGHSAQLISRKMPPNLKKVDYYPGAQLAYDVLDVQMRKCLIVGGKFYSVVA